MFTPAVGVAAATGNSQRYHVHVFAETRPYGPSTSRAALFDAVCKSVDNFTDLCFMFNSFN
jgi:hypothetical protein